MEQFPEFRNDFARSPPIDMRRMETGKENVTHPRNSHHDHDFGLTPRIDEIARTEKKRQRLSRNERCVKKNHVDGRRDGIRRRVSKSKDISDKMR